MTLFVPQYTVAECRQLPLIAQMKQCMTRTEAQRMRRIMKHYEAHNYPDRLRNLHILYDTIK